MGSPDVCAWCASRACVAICFNHCHSLVLLVYVCVSLFHFSGFGYMLRQTTTTKKKACKK